MQKKPNKNNRTKSDKNTVCRIPVQARYSLKDGIITREEVKYSDIPTEQFAQFIVNGLGIDFEAPTGTWHN